MDAKMLELNIKTLISKNLIKVIIDVSKRYINVSAVCVNLFLASYTWVYYFCWSLIFFCFHTLVLFIYLVICFYKDIIAWTNRPTNKHMHIYESVTQPALYLKLRLMKDIPHTLKTTVCLLQSYFATDNNRQSCKMQQILS